MMYSRTPGRAGSRAAPAISLAALAVGMLLVAMFAGTAFAQSPDASASVDPVATTAASPDAANTDAASTDAGVSPDATTLPDTATGDLRSDGTSSSMPLVLGMVAVAAAIVLAVGFMGAQSRARRVREDDTRT